MAEMIIHLEIDKKTQKKNIYIKYISDEDALPMEHEEAHQALVDQLIEGGTLTAAEVGDITVERLEEAPIVLPESSDEDIADSLEQEA